MNSPPRGLEKLKMENGYMGKGGFVGHRRSTGQRYYEPGRSEPPKKFNGFGSADGVVARYGSTLAVGAVTQRSLDSLRFIIKK